MNAYEQKQEARRERLEAAADRAEVRAGAAFEKADLREEKSGIPFGQPILVGHHSEGKHRRAIARADNAMRKGIKESDRAKELRGRAASVGEGGISSDDPEAIAKLKAKIAAAEASQQLMKDMNAAWRKYKKNPDSPATKKALDSLPEKYRAIVVNYVPQYSWETGPGQGFALSNNNANIKRMKKRVEELEKNATRETTEQEYEGFKVIRNAEANRIQFVFDGKPPEAQRKIMKSNGFRWSPREGAWQRHLNGNGTYAARYALTELQELAEA